MMTDSARRESINIAGCKISCVIAGSPGKPPILLLHGFPSSSRSFRDIIPRLSAECFVIAPDLPGFGQSALLPNPTFARFADVMHQLLIEIGITNTYLYVHDFGAPVALELALREPQRVLGLVVQNANAHSSGHGAGWKDTIDFWQTPSEENQRRATAHLTFEGTRDQYIGGIPDDIAARISADNWIEDWRTMSQPGHLDLQRALIADYGNYAARFDDIARYLREHQPPALMLWGRHDIFFDAAEILSWIQDLPRMEAHILDGPHLLLETHAGFCAERMVEFVRRQRRTRALQR